MSKDLDALIDKEFDSVYNLAKVDTTIKTYYDSGVYALNYVCSKNLFGAYPKGRIIGIDGLAGSGKSLLAATAMRDPKIDMVVIVESEGGGHSQELLEFAGVDKSKVKILKASTLVSYKLNKKTGEVEEISDKEIPKNKDTDKYLYVEGAGYLIRKLANLVQFNKIEKNILIILDSLGNMQSIRGLGGCWYKDTMVAYLNGDEVDYKKIQDVEIGESVLTHLGTFEVVDNKFEYLDKEELIEIEDENGSLYKLTPNHKLLVSRNGKTEWVEAGNLSVDDELLKIDI